MNINIAVTFDERRKDLKPKECQGFKLNDLSWSSLHSIYGAKTHMPVP
jgi:hypothetical protein